MYGPEKHLNCLGQSRGLRLFTDYVDLHYNRSNGVLYTKDAFVDLWSKSVICTTVVIAIFTLLLCLFYVLFALIMF